MTEPLVLELLALPKAVPEARRAVRDHLRAPCPEVQLCVSELLTNVIRHLGEGTPVTVRLYHAPDGRIRLEVTDPDARAWLVARTPDETDETGRGLLLLDAVARRWGVWLSPVGKTVWCELYEDAALGSTGGSVPST
ncbi:ATP-binding protein [Streptomyces sp. TRM70350]|uniref:ATP-binding protein n=1 Tax=Streptomyces sp. TRM70350 TaxID=2856165 RepID=UPI001C44AEE9|nr:ATP-binding protein [Streptomyces sp. TRM70350]MBV7699010.1 ATP-binding protein [Streptomyces sp. TRM70350]